MILDVDIEQLRGLGAVAAPCSPNSWHPFIRTLQAYRNGNCTGYAGSPLEQYYSRYCPKTIGDVLGLQLDAQSGPLAEDALGFILPWSRAGIQATRLARLATIQREHVEHGGPQVGWHG